MSEGPETPPFSTVDINNDNREEEDLFASAVQEVSLEPEVNGARESLEQATLNDPPSIAPAVSSPIMEEIATERANNIIITITEPQKIGEGMSSYVAYRVLTKTNMPIFSKHEFAVLRRFSDFLGLHEKLTEKYLRSGRIIPPAPEKSLMGTTKLKMSSTPSTESANGNTTPSSVQSQFVERRRAALERFLNRVAQHPVLCIDPDFRQFLESDTELPKATSTSALSGAGVLRLFNKVGETVNKITYRMDESDSWFEERSARIEALETCLRRLYGACESLANERRELETCLRRLYGACESLANERRELGVRTHDASRACAALSGADPHAPLSRALSHLADLHEKVEQLRIEQSNTDYYVLTEHIKDYLGLIGAIKDVFHERVKVFQNWQHAQMQLTKRRENKAKAELANRPDKAEQASQEIIEWESKVERGQQEFDQISRVIKKELERWEEIRLNDLRATVLKYLEEHVKHQAQISRVIKKELERWEEIRLNDLRATVLEYLEEHVKHQAQISRVIKKELERWEEIRLNDLRATVLKYLEEHVKHQAQISRVIKKELERWEEIRLNDLRATVLKYLEEHVKHQAQRWEEIRLNDLRATVLKYLEEHVKHQAQAIRYWDAFLPEARAIK
ncbi:PX domain-containing protein [Phthorimaea operculella]|nr:PX domain-containing protein [Phthorimaea operculella]